MLSELTNHADSNRAHHSRLTQDAMFRDIETFVPVRVSNFLSF